MGQTPTVLPPSFIRSDSSQNNNTNCEIQPTDPGPSSLGIVGDISEAPTQEGQYTLWRAGTKIGVSNKLIKVGKAFIGSRLLTNGNWVIEEIAPFAKAMFDQARADGMSLGLISGFRTYEHQAALYEKYQAWEGWKAANGWRNGDPVPPDAPKFQALTAYPGRSNHQNGIALDIYYGQSPERKCKEYVWLCKNAWRYGFVRTVFTERWHWEYRGDWSTPDMRDGVMVAAPTPQKPSWATNPVASMFTFIPRYHRLGIKGNDAKSLQTEGAGTLIAGEAQLDPQRAFITTAPGEELSTLEILRRDALGNKYIGSDVSALNRNNKVLPSKNWLTKKCGAPSTHPDAALNGQMNSWIGYEGFILPDLFDVIDPHWEDPATPTWGYNWQTRF